MGRRRAAGAAPRPGQCTDIAGLPEQKHRTAIDQFRVAFGGANETLAFIDIADDDDDAMELTAELSGTPRSAMPMTGSSTSPATRRWRNACRPEPPTRGRSSTQRPQVLLAIKPPDLARLAAAPSAGAT